MKYIYVTEIRADEGMILTNGSAYGRSVRLVNGAGLSDWYEITEAEYERLRAQQDEEENIY